MKLHFDPTLFPSWVIDIFLLIDLSDVSVLNGLGIALVDNVDNTSIH